jgi:predicted lipid-binding transport protein (Tim44 family)
MIFCGVRKANVVKYLLCDTIMELGILIRNGALVLATLGVTYMSQQPMFKNSNQQTQVYSQGISGGVKKATSWISDNIPLKQNGGVATNLVLPDTTAVSKYVSNEVEKQKNNLVQNSLDATKRFLAKEVLDILGVKPEDLAKCPS